MKTRIYYPQIETKVISLLLVLSLAFLISVKAQELPKDPSLASFAEGINTLPNALMDDYFTGKETVNNELALTLKSWMNSGQYWELVQDEPQSEGTMKMLVEWMKEGKYWEENEEGNLNKNNDYHEIIAENEGE